MTLAAEGVSYAYGRRFRLGPVSFSLAPGELVALIGPNGAGKTTLLRVLAGLLFASEGRISWDGKAAPARLLRRTVALTPTEPAFPTRSTVGELLRLRARHLGCPWAPAAEKLQAALGCPLDAPPHRLSRGQRLQVALALALLGDPPVILADEPWSGLDPLALELLRQRSAAAAVLVSSHDLHNLATVAHRFVVLHEGTVRFAGSLADILEATGETDGTGALKVLYRQIVEGRRP